MMPLTQLTAREYADLQLLQQGGFGDLFEQGLAGYFPSQDEEQQFKEYGQIFYGEEGTNALFYYWKEITSGEQIKIDDFIRTISQRSDKADIPGMPKSTLTVYEYNLLKDIMRYKIGDIWERKIVDETSLKYRDNAKLEIAGTQLLGSNDLYLAFFEDIGLTEDQ